MQQRHDGPSGELARKTVAAQYKEAGNDVGIPRRSMIVRTALGAAGLFGVAAGIQAIGPFVRQPWKGGGQAVWITGWKSLNGETVYLRLKTSVTGEIVRLRPGDMKPTGHPGAQTTRPAGFQTTATITPSPRYARIWVVRPRCTIHRIRSVSARVTNQSS